MFLIPIPFSVFTIYISAFPISLQCLHIPFSLHFVYIRTEGAILFFSYIQVFTETGMDQSPSQGLFVSEVLCVCARVSVYVFCVSVCYVVCVCVCVVWWDGQVWCVSGVSRGGCSEEKPMGVRGEPLPGLKYSL